MIIICGKTASGKDLIVNKLVSEHGFKKVITYTTRPIRNGEIEDTTYHYISNDDFKQKIKQGFFAEWKSYNTEFGIWYYGVALEDLKNSDEKNVVILTPDGYREVVNLLDKKTICIYIYANSSTIRKRLISRGDDSGEAKRRLEQDNRDFKGIENEVDKIIYNNEGTNVEEVISKILEYMEEYE